MANNLLPRLRNHVEYDQCLNNLAILEQRIADTKADVTHYSGSPHLGPESADDGDLDLAVSATIAAQESFSASRLRAQLKLQAFERLLELEKLKVPELHRQALENIEKSACHQSSVLEGQASDLSSKLSGIYDAHRKLRDELRLAVNETLPGYTAFQAYSHSCPVLRQITIA